MRSQFSGRGSKPYGLQREAKSHPLDRAGNPSVSFWISLILTLGAAFWGERTGFNDLVNFWSHCLEGLTESETWWWEPDGFDSSRLFCSCEISLKRLF